MKKVILSLLVAGSLMATSCKKAKEAKNSIENATKEVVKEGAEAANKAGEAAKEAAAKAGEAVKSAIEGVTIPEFKDPKVGEHLKSYSEYAKEYIAAGGDVKNNAALAKKGAELAAKGQEIVKGLDAESAKKFQGVMSSIQSKMAPAK